MDEFGEMLILVKYFGQMNGFGEVVLAKWTNLAKWLILVKLFWPNEGIWRSGFGGITLMAHEY